jgi:hypothetical protein
MGFSITRASAVLKSIKWNITGADLYEEFKKVLQGPNFPIQKLDELAMNGAPSMVNRNSKTS